MYLWFVCLLQLPVRGLFYAIGHDPNTSLFKVHTKHTHTYISETCMCIHYQLPAKHVCIFDKSMWNSPPPL